MASESDGAADTIQTLYNFKFNEVGIHNLQQALGDGEVYHWYQAHFDATDLAWLMVGTHCDSNHNLPPQHFHHLQWEDACLTLNVEAAAAKKACHDLQDALQCPMFNMVSFSCIFIHWVLTDNVLGM